MKLITVRLLSLLLMILMCVPLPTAAMIDSSRTNVDLLDFFNQNIAISFSAVESDKYTYERARNNDWYDPVYCWLLQRGTSQYAYGQIDFGDSYQLTEIKFSLRQLTTSDTHRKNIAVWLSNDPSFTKCDVVWTTSGNEDPGLDIISVDVHENPEFNDKYYRYIRFAKINSQTSGFGIAELEIYGYTDPYEPEVVNLTDFADVYATAEDFAKDNQNSSTAYVAENVLSDEGEWVWNRKEESKGWIQIDLRRKSSIYNISVTPIDNLSASQNFRVLLSNDKGFESFIVAGTRDYGNAGSPLEISGLNTDMYRYIRVEKTVEGEEAGFKRIQVFGLAGDNQVTVSNLAKDASVSASSNLEGYYPQYTTDGKLYSISEDGMSGSWRAEPSDINPYIIYDLGESKTISEVLVMPCNNCDSRENLGMLSAFALDYNAHKNFAVMGSNDGNSYTVIANVGESGIENGVFTVFNADDSLYRYIKIEKTVQGDTSDVDLSFAEVKIIYNSIGQQVVSTYPENNAVAVSNVATSKNYIEITFAKTLMPEALSSESVIITSPNGNVSHKNSIVDGNVYKVPLSNLKSDTVYNVNITSAVRAKFGSFCLPYDFSFTTGKIIDSLIIDGTSMVNVALNKKIVSSGTINANQYYEKKLVDGSEGTGATDCSLLQGNTNGRVYFYIDLQNYYNIRKLEWVTRYASSSVSNYNGVKIAGSADNVSPENFNTKMIPLYTLSSSEFENGDNKTFEINLPSEIGKIRYIAIYNDNISSNIGASEFRAYAVAEETFGSWQVTSADTEVTALNGSGNYTFTIPVTSYRTNNQTYTMLIAAYDSNGFMKELTCQVVTANSAATSNLTKQFIFDETDIAKVTAILIRNIKDAYMPVDSVDLIAQ